MELAEFPRFLKLGLTKDSGTLAIEALGSELVQSDFKVQHIGKFVKEVCKWGHYAGIAG